MKATIVLTLAAAALGLLLAACGGKAGPAATATPFPTLPLIRAAAAIATPTLTLSPAPTATPAPTPTPTPAPTPTPTPAPTPTPEATGIQFFLDLVEPTEAEVIVTEPSLHVVGRTRVDAVVTVNDAVVEPDAKGFFSATVVLEEGPNIIEVVASVETGEQESLVLVAVYIPS